MIDILSPAGPQAAHIRDLWNITLVICTIVFAGILAVLIYVLWKRPRAGAGDAPDLESRDRPETSLHRRIALALGASVSGLLFLIVASVLTDRALAHLSVKDALHVEVTANQWWWEARYDDAQASRIFTTANELHIPVGRPVIFTLKSNDVIHSLWVPQLAGKKDLIPGRTATLNVFADRPGTYRGQCAEFCGFQHSLMALQVTAKPVAEFEAWADHQRQSAPEPVDAREIRGRELFLGTSCVMCHSVQGTTASARRGPDLTHVAARQTLAAGTLPNTAEDLKRWIRNPQQFKPGSNMPATNLPEADLDALVAWLQTLR
jgi:cytochrome c oxidase subunit II